MRIRSAVAAALIAACAAGTASAQDESLSFWVGAPEQAVLKRMSIVCDARGLLAPTVNPIAPYGTRNALGDLGALIRESAPESARTPKSLHLGTEQLLEIALDRAVLAPGTYPLHTAPFESPNPDLLRPCPGTDQNEFKFTEEHLRMIRSLVVQWNSSWEAYFEDALEVPGISARSPYGDREEETIELQIATVIQSRPARIIGKNERVYSSEQLKSFRALHEELGVALTVFLQNAELYAGEYRHKEFTRPWKPTKEPPTPTATAFPTETSEPTAEPTAEPEITIDPVDARYPDSPEGSGVSGDAIAEPSTGPLGAADEVPPTAGPTPEPAPMPDDPLAEPTPDAEAPDGTSGE